LRFGLSAFPSDINPVRLLIIFGGDSSGPHEHLEAARTRAVEEALPLLSTTDTEITAAFDPRSHELAHLPHGAIHATSVSL
jgi:apolipoprotein N-acyltransferase